ncbi:MULTISPECIES: LysE family translocator [Brucella/Ochrobactrum group]|uniref:Threonine/homoserine/homoserine lactone efflux protein n=1 Tax=Brucella pseudogrignonensis TaxID=419475 RepID=A0ABU1MFQ6_9HYPH|nr:LysE family translocator [Brucella pseudogrignonensis]MDR6434451.1 threonine/homoserine/homoserine lactone efflux protein [Brucella pseudogrignonensis]
MDLTSLVVFAGILVVAAGTPGPNVGALVARVISRGHKGVFPFMFGLWLGDAIWLSLAVWGLSAIANSFHTVFLVLKYLGVAYLIYLAWKMWIAPVETTADESAIPSYGEARKLFFSALAVTLGNPKIMVFYIAILPTVIDITHVSVVGWLELLLVMFAVLAAVDSAWVVLAAQARRFLRSPRAMRIANRTSAGMMAGAAVAIATR